MKLYSKIIGGDTSEKVVIDLAIPNNVDKEVTENFNMSYIDQARRACSKLWMTV